MMKNQRNFLFKYLTEIFGLKTSIFQKKNCSLNEKIKFCAFCVKNINSRRLKGLKRYVLEKYQMSIQLQINNSLLNTN